jgi:excisionase family DNA binding protein
MNEDAWGHAHIREIMTLQEAANYLKCRQSTVYRRLKSGELKGFRLVGGWRFRRKDIDRWIADRGSAPRRGPKPKLT